jgi:SSS family solute:Na+ symporter
VWLGYLVLWFLADPMFPHLFQRFYSARDDRAIKTTVILYPLITTGLFFLMVSIGVMGRAALPDLTAAQSDQIYPLLLGRYCGVFLGTLLFTGSIAALMSTMDSQLLTVTSIITRDVLGKQRPRVHALTVSILGLTGFLIALRPPLTILGFINRTTFNGLAVLAPAVFGGLYWPRGTSRGALVSILAGEILVVLAYFGIPKLPFLHPILLISVVTAAVYILGSLLTGKAAPAKISRSRPRWIWLGVFAFLFVLANDFWNWNRTPRLLAGLPLWVWYFVLLGLALSGAFAMYLRRSEDYTGSARRSQSSPCSSRYRRWCG